jgi:hypothetical protein
LWTLIGTAAGVGIVSYYGLIRTMGSALGSATPQIVTFAVSGSTANTILMHVSNRQYRRPIVTLKLRAGGIMASEGKPKMLQLSMATGGQPG